MFNIGGGELLVIALIALIVLGPERLPGAARQIGKTLADLRRLSSGFQDELRGALDTDPAQVAGPKRNVLGEGAGTASADGSVSAAVRSVSGEPLGAVAPDEATTAGSEPKRPTRRREPLVARPASPNGRKAAPAASAEASRKRATPLQKGSARSARRSTR